MSTAMCGPEVERVHERSKGPRRSTWRGYEWITGVDDRPRTPLGHPVVSRYDILSQRILADLREYGEEPHSPSSAYRLQALYLDFASAASAQELTDAVLRALAVPHEGTAATSDRAWASVWRASPGGHS